MTKIIDKIKHIFSSKKNLMLFFISHGFFNWMNDEKFLKMKFRLYMGRELPITNPKTFNEKLQWLKLYDRNPIYTTMVDKYAVKKYVADIIGEQYIIPTLGVWNRFDDIDFNSLPNSFVLKCTHDSGGLVICKNKSNLNKERIRKIINKSLRRNYYNTSREWPYKNVPPRIIAEKYMTDDENSEGFTDYKFFCFDGKVDCVMVCLDRYTGDTKFYFFDKDWNLKRLNKRGKAAPEGFTIPKPECMDLMFELAAKLSEGLSFVRVDLYQSCGQVCFGELTFYPDSGFDENILPEADEYFGSLIKIKK